MTEPIAALYLVNSESEQDVVPGKLMKKIHVFLILSVGYMFVGCATERPPLLNSRETVSLLVTRSRVQQKYMVEAKITTVTASTRIPTTPTLVPGTDITAPMPCTGHVDVLSIPDINVIAGNWAEFRICSTNTPAEFSATTYIGGDKITVTHPQGIVFKVKIQPVTGEVVRAYGILSIGSEDSTGTLHKHRVVPFLSDCILGTPTTIFTKEYTSPNSKSAYLLTEEWELADGTTNQSTIPQKADFLQNNEPILTNEK